MRIIFLNTNGVLNHYSLSDSASLPKGQFYQEQIEELNRIIEATGAKIVLTSSLRSKIYSGDMTIDGMNCLFQSHGVIKNSIIGCIDKRNEITSDFDLIGKWLLENNSIEQYVVLNTKIDSRFRCIPIDFECGLISIDSKHAIVSLLCDCKPNNADHFTNNFCDECRENWRK